MAPPLAKLQPNSLAAYSPLLHQGVSLPPSPHHWTCHVLQNLGRSQRAAAADQTRLVPGCCSVPDIQKPAFRHGASTSASILSFNWLCV